MRTLRALALLFAGLAAGPAFARAGVSPIDYRDEQIVTSSGKPLDLAGVRAAIARAAGTRGWSLTQVSPNELVAGLVVRGKHKVAVRIIYDAKKFSILYHSSEDMNFKVEEGVPYIHPKYNEWVGNLAADVRKEFAKL